MQSEARQSESKQCKAKSSDAKRNEIYAGAYSQDPDFFAFYRSMEAYRQSLKGDNTTMIVEPQGEFFRYFGAESGRGTTRG